MSAANTTLRLGTGSRKPGLVPYIWSRSYAATYDSSWWLLKQLAALNKSREDNFLREVLALPHSHVVAKRRPEENSALTCDCLKPMMAELGEPTLQLTRCHRGWHWIDKRTVLGGGEGFAQIPFRSELLVRNLAFYAGSMTTYVAHCEQTRFCPECIEIGYISVFFQLAALQRCPIHQCRIVERCPRCHLPSVPFRFQRGSFHDAFTCECGWPEAYEGVAPFEKTTSFMEAEKVAMRPLVSWLSEIGSLDLDLSHLLQKGRDQGMSASQAARALHPVLTAIIPFNGDQNLFVKLRPLMVKKLAQPSVTAPTATTEYRIQLKTIYKSVRRYVERRLVRADARRIFGQNLGRFAVVPATQCVIPDSEACILSQAYTLWRLRTDRIAFTCTSRQPVPARCIPRYEAMESRFGDNSPTLFAHAALGHYFAAIRDVLYWATQYRRFDRDMHQEILREACEERTSRFFRNVSFAREHLSDGMRFASRLNSAKGSPVYVFYEDPAILVRRARKFHTRLCAEKANERAGRPGRLKKIKVNRTNARYFE